METIGIDLHRKRSRFVRLSQEGAVLEKGTIRSTAEGFREAFGGLDSGNTRVALEATGYWYWAADVLEELGLETHLANPHKVRVIAESTIKTDTVDATALAHLLRLTWLPESRITPKAMRAPARAAAVSHHAGPHPHRSQGCGSTRSWASAGSRRRS